MQTKFPVPVSTHVEGQRRVHHLTEMGRHTESLFKNERRTALAREAARLDGKDYESASRAEKARYQRQVNPKLRGWDHWDDLLAAKRLITEIETDRREGRHQADIVINRRGDANDDR